MLQSMKKSETFSNLLMQTHIIVVLNKIMHATLLLHLISCCQMKNNDEGIWNIKVSFLSLNYLSKL